MTPPASSDDWAVWYGGQRQCTGRRTSTFSPFLHIPCAELAFGFHYYRITVKGFCFGFDLTDLFDLQLYSIIGFGIFVLWFNSYFGFEV